MHLAQDVEPELDCDGAGVLVVGAELGDVVDGSGFGLLELGLDVGVPWLEVGVPVLVADPDGELGEVLVDVDGSGCGPEEGAVPCCAPQRTRVEWAGHFTAAVEILVRCPDDRQAVTVTGWPVLAARPDWAVQYTADELAGPITAAVEIRDRCPDDRQAVTVMCRPEVPTRPDCTVQWTAVELAGHFAAVAESWLSFPDDKQAVTATFGLARCVALARSTVSEGWLPATAYPPAAAATRTASVAARGKNFLRLL